VTSFLPRIVFNPIKLRSTGYRLLFVALPAAKYLIDNASTHARTQLAISKQSRAFLNQSIAAIWHPSIRPSIRPDGRMWDTKD
jgi:hypothetical protein